MLKYYNNISISGPEWAPCRILVWLLFSARRTHTYILCMNLVVGGKSRANSTLPDMFQDTCFHKCVAALSTFVGLVARDSVTAR